MTLNYYQDIFYILIGFIFTGLIAGYSFFKKPHYLLAGLTLLLSLAGVTDAFFHYSSDPAILLLAESGLVLCGTLTLATLAQFALRQLLGAKFPAGLRTDLFFYLPALLVTAVHALTPWLIDGITAGAYGFELRFASGYWLLIGVVACYALLAAAFVLPVALQSARPREREQALVLLFALILCVYFYGSALVVPFFFAAGNIASPLPLTFAAMALIYSCLKYGYFAQ